MQKPSSNRAITVWQADIISIAVLIVFILAVIGLDALLDPDFSPTSLLITGVLLSIVPAFIWIAFFYRRDRLEPEPKGMVLQVFVLGGLLAAAIGQPVIHSLFEVSTWMTRSVLSHLVGAVLVIGFTQEFLKYVAVRFSVYGSREFDESVDGIIYATAAGLGYAAVLNVAFVIESGGVDLGTGIIRITVTSLAHASFAGVTGYFLGTDKFGNKPVWWTAAGVGLAAVLNGIFFYLRSTLTSGGLTASGGSALRWLGFVLAALLAVGTTSLLSAAIRRQTGSASQQPEEV